MDRPSSPSSSTALEAVDLSTSAARPATAVDERSDPPLLHLAVGLAQGLGVHALWTGWCHGCAVDSTTLWRTAMLYAALLAPMVWHFTSGGVRSRIGRTTAAVACGLLFGAMAAWTYARVNPPLGWWGSPLAMPDFNLPLVVLAVVTVSLLIDADRLLRQSARAASTDLVGRNAVLLTAALALTALFWVVLVASGWLMEAIGVQAWQRALTRFGFIVTCGAFGLAIGSMLRRPRALEAIRATALQSVGWLLPIALAFLVVWTTALLVTGFAVLAQTSSAALYLSWFGTVCIVLANAWFRGQGAAASTAEGRWSRWLQPAMAKAWLLTNLLPAAAAWALWVRIDQYGLTPERVWGVAVCGVVALCTLGYSVFAWTRARWLASLPATNTVAALLLAGTIALLITPLGDAHKLSVFNQVARLRSGQVTPDAFDWNFLAHGSGRYGDAALQQLAAMPRDTPHDAAVAMRAEQELAAIERAGAEGPPKASAEVPDPRP